MLPSEGMRSISEWSRGCHAAAPMPSLSAVPRITYDQAALKHPLAASHVSRQIEYGAQRRTEVTTAQGTVEAAPWAPSRPHSQRHLQSQPHEWPGLVTWRAKGRDLRLRWGPPSGAAGPLEVPVAEAPTLESAMALVTATATSKPDQHAGAAVPSLSAPALELRPPGSLVEAGLRVLRTASPACKAALTHAAWGAYLEGKLPLRPPDSPAQQRHQREPRGLQWSGLSLPLPLLLPDHPARPERPRLVRPKQIPGHESSPLGLNGYMLHNLAHIELNAIDLAWDTVVRFSPLGLPDQFYEDFARVADDESRHLGWCLQRMEELGHCYGDMDAHDLLWQGCRASSVDLGARLAVVPMSQEARGLDAGTRLVSRLVGFGDSRSAAVVGLIAEEERAHVAVGVTWFSRLCGTLEIRPDELYRQWLLHLNPDLLKGPFNHSERGRVGLPREWYDPTVWPERADEEAGKGDAEQLEDEAGGSGTAGSNTSSSTHASTALTPPSSLSPSSSDQGARQPRRPSRGSPHPRLKGPQPRLTLEQLAVLAQRLSVFGDVEVSSAITANLESTFPHAPTLTCVHADAHTLPNSPHGMQSGYLSDVPSSQGSTDPHLSEMERNGERNRRGKTMHHGNGSLPNQESP
ncbi:hypothetical protein VaNZ11_010555 [Volvox africanus]|uniref:DUF455 family protein n=1 Tax=Volvox africanus TaxID=51714 RepID=A0ABQ5SA34_9CHLO|nr:hypothetical protein VaNZ11_010555 [Volvox africanus]